MNIKKYIPIEWKLYATYLLSSKEDWKDIEKYKNKKKIIIALAADYANMGDVAVNVAQYDFLKENFPEYEIINFPIAKTFTYMKSLKSIVNDDDIITCIGGGNLGDIYWDMELCREFVIKNFPNNKIVSFPQTFFHEDEKKVKKCIKVFSKHKDLSFAIRETNSLEYCKKNLKNPVVFTPDTALMLKYDKELNRDGISVLLRNDKEGTLTEEDNLRIVNDLKKDYAVNVYDTLIKIDKKRISYEEGKTMLYDLLDKIASSKVVVTNRLHAMVFCAVTKTPCIVLPIPGVKVKGVYYWLKDLNYIKCIDDYNVDNIISNIENLKDITPNELNLKDKYKPLIEEIKINKFG